MKLVANGVNKNFLESYLPPIGAEVDGVLAAIAYGNDDNEKLVQSCISLGCRLDIWMRYDHTVPVQPSLLKKLLSKSKENVFCKLIPDVLHSKVIWWRGYGAYIGSANLTGRAWTTNIETGVFLDDGELLSSGMDVQLEDFFETLENDCESYTLSKDIVLEMEELQQRRRAIREIDNDTENKRKIAIWKGLSNVDKKKAVDRNRQMFYQEWLETKQILDDIAESVTEFRPQWLADTIPAPWQADQFLHAFYYNEVSEGGNRYPYDEYYQKNRNDPARATRRALEWWSKLPAPPSQEDINLYERAPYIRDHLRKELLLDLDVTTLERICEYTHATKDHVIKIPLADIGEPILYSLPREQRLQLYAEWLLGQKNAKGQNILQLLYYVLYGGEDSEIHERLYNAARDPEYRIRHYGLNSIAEVTGWALPDVVPPRNGRTSKALKALGYPVKIY